MGVWPYFLLVNFMYEDAKYLNALNSIINIRSFCFSRILALVSAREIWQSSYKKIVQSGLDSKTAWQLVQDRSKIDPEQEAEKLKKHNIRVITGSDPEFPRLLKEITPPAPILYIKGNMDLLNQKVIAIVGTRKATDYGLQVAQDLAAGLSSAGLVIVSGLAFGIDCQAHKTTLENKGNTIAVLGSGLDLISPRSNHWIAEQILEKDGSIISEFPLGYPASKFTFPERNHIISGLSLGVIVVEAGFKSGALITARAALEQNREVFCVPGNVYSENSRGCNKFISDGARLVTCAEDVLQVLNINRTKARINKQMRTKVHSPATAEEKDILENLGANPVSIDYLAEKTGLAVEKIAAVLGQMEMEDVVRDVGGGRYVVN